MFTFESITHGYTLDLTGTEMTLMNYVCAFLCVQCMQAIDVTIWLCYMCTAVNSM